ncbi:helix-turn-helix domain-containing protein [Enterococcus faecalis]|uniref:helix-turn-helix domain-containing protein n=1 Tax=Enterococcus faecalis TaxID=1351 RepID=UPI001E4BF5C8|nr:helix-turn-helix domain-containing protein [Enterococcus faecalis]MCR1938557.1 helix-turn-helix domain-containing protein [Enterococcus faecalis]MDL4975280.1 helix-turn-helix domain-containing protein [Enterococcus faecalis]
MKAQKGDVQSIEIILKRFQPLIKKECFFNGKINEDCYQECMVAIYLAIFKFKVID